MGLEMPNPSNDILKCIMIVQIFRTRSPYLYLIIDVGHSPNPLNEEVEFQINNNYVKIIRF